MFPLFQNISLDFCNYIYLFFNYELLVVLCFFFFLIFALIAEKGQLGTYLYDVSLEQRMKFTRYLNQRDLVLNEFIVFLEKSILEIKKISTSYEHSSLDLLLNIQYLIKKGLLSLTIFQVKTYLDIITARSQYLAFQIKLYLSTDLFLNKSFKLKQKHSKNVSKL
jgi:hypothetical protein